MVDKTAISKGLVPHAGNHVIVAHNQHNFLRLLDFVSRLVYNKGLIYWRFLKMENPYLPA